MKHLMIIGIMLAGIMLINTGTAEGQNTPPSSVRLNLQKQGFTPKNVKIFDSNINTNGTDALHFSKPGVDFSVILTNEGYQGIHVQGNFNNPLVTVIFSELANSVTNLNQYITTAAVGSAILDTELTPITNRTVFLQDAGFGVTEAFVTFNDLGFYAFNGKHTTTAIKDIRNNSLFRAGTGRFVANDGSGLLNSTGSIGTIPGLTVRQLENVRNVGSFNVPLYEGFAVGKTLFNAFAATPLKTIITEIDGQIKTETQSFTPQQTLSFLTNNLQVLKGYFNLQLGQVQSHAYIPGSNTPFSSYIVTTKLVVIGERVFTLEETVGPNGNIIQINRKSVGKFLGKANQLPNGEYNGDPVDNVVDRDPFTLWGQPILYGDNGVLFFGSQETTRLAFVLGFEDLAGEFKDLSDQSVSLNKFNYAKRVNEFNAFLLNDFSFDFKNNNQDRIIQFNSEGLVISSLKTANFSFAEVQIPNGIFVNNFSSVGEVDFGVNSFPTTFYPAIGDFFVPTFLPARVERENISLSELLQTDENTRDLKAITLNAQLLNSENELLHLTDLLAVDPSRFVHLFRQTQKRKSDLEAIDLSSINFDEADLYHKILSNSGRTLQYHLVELFDHNDFFPSSITESWIAHLEKEDPVLYNAIKSKTDAFNASHETEKSVFFAPIYSVSASLSPEFVNRIHDPSNGAITIGDIRLSIDLSLTDARINLVDLEHCQPVAGSGISLTSEEEAFLQDAWGKDVNADGQIDDGFAFDLLNRMSKVSHILELLIQRGSLPGYDDLNTLLVVEALAAIYNKGEDFQEFEDFLVRNPSHFTDGELLSIQLPQKRSNEQNTVLAKASWIQKNLGNRLSKDQSKATSNKFQCKLEFTSVDFRSKNTNQATVGDGYLGTVSIANKTQSIIRNHKIRIRTNKASDLGYFDMFDFFINEIQPGEEQLFTFLYYPTSTGNQTVQLVSDTDREVIASQTLQVVSRSAAWNINSVCDEYKEFNRILTANQRAFAAGKEVFLSSEIRSSATFEAIGTSNVYLKPGFQAKYGSNTTIKSQNCASVVSRVQSELGL